MNTKHKSKAVLTHLNTLKAGVEKRLEQVAAQHIYMVPEHAIGFNVILRGYLATIEYALGLLILSYEDEDMLMTLGTNIVELEAASEVDFLPMDVAFSKIAANHALRRMSKAAA